SQQARGLLGCPVCDTKKGARKLSVPRINMGRTQEPATAQTPSPNTARAAVAAPAGAQLAQLQAHMMRQIRQIVRNTENVGDRFASEARRMHDGEVQERAIRGTATSEEREALAEEGIAVMPIP